MSYSVIGHNSMSMNQQYIVNNVSLNGNSHKRRFSIDQLRKNVVIRSLQEPNLVLPVGAWFSVHQSVFAVTLQDRTTTSPSSPSVFFPKRREPRMALLPPLQTPGVFPSLQERKNEQMGLTTRGASANLAREGARAAGHRFSSSFAHVL